MMYKHLEKKKKRENKVSRAKTDFEAKPIILREQNDLPHLVVEKTLPPREKVLFLALSVAIMSSYLIPLCRLPREFPLGSPSCSLGPTLFLLH